MRYTPKSKWPVKYVVRVREIENDQRTERSWEFLSAREAQALANKAAEAGWFPKVLKVADWKQLERV